MKIFIITIFMAVTIFSYSYTTSTQNYTEAKNFAYAGLGCMITGSVLYGLMVPIVSIGTICGLSIYQFSPVFIWIPIVIQMVF